MPLEIKPDGKLVFRFKDDTEVERWKAERRKLKDEVLDIDDVDSEERPGCYPATKG